MNHTDNDTTSARPTGEDADLERVGEPDDRTDGHPKRGSGATCTAIDV